MLISSCLSDAIPTNFNLNSDLLPALKTKSITKNKRQNCFGSTVLQTINPKGNQAYLAVELSKD